MAAITARLPQALTEDGRVTGSDKLDAEGGMHHMAPKEMEKGEASTHEMRETAEAKNEAKDKAKDKAKEMAVEVDEEDKASCPPLESTSDDDEEKASLLRRFCRTLTPRQWVRVGVLGAAIMLLHVLGWGMLLLAVVPKRLALPPPTGTFGVGLGITAYTLGLRHALDADHIASIDNIIRKLVGEGREWPVSVGFWFALGHSSVVLLAATLVAAGFRTFASQVAENNSRLHHVTGLVGACVSGTFLILIGTINLVAFGHLVKAFRRHRSGQSEGDGDGDEAGGGPKGLMSRMLVCVSSRIREPWQMFPLGFLFGLGFDTATEVTLLFLAGGAASSGLPWYAILTLPVLFAAGMTLLDTTDGIVMYAAYGWAFTEPGKRLRYNLIVTGLSAALALLIGGIQLLQVAVEESGAHGPATDWLQVFDLNTIGFLVVGLFAVTWGIGVAWYLIPHLRARYKKWAVKGGQ